MHNIGLRSSISTAVAATVLAACGGGDQDAASSALAATPQDACRAVVARASPYLPDTTTVIESANLLEYSAATATASALPQHCEVLGHINKRVSAVDGQTYAIRFHMRLPTQGWTGRFLQTGGGGSNGNLGSAFGDLPAGLPGNGLARGFAVITTDAGHDNATNSRPDFGATGAFGMDPQARRDHFYNAYDKVAQTGKALVPLVYGKRADRSYFAGCSEGGREAMMMTQRFPAHFDGVIAGAPQIHQPKQSMASVAGTQALARYAAAQGLLDPTGNPAIHKIFSDADLQLTSNAINRGCDTADGVADGMVNNIKACTDAVVAPELERLACAGVKTNGCLLPGQIDLLKVLHGATRNARGQELYPAYPWDPGITATSSGFRGWWLGSYDAATSNSIRLNLSTPLLLMVWETPPSPFTAASSLPRYLAYDYLGKDPDPALNFPANGIYAESPGVEMINSKTDLTAFRSRGGKLIVWGGTADATSSFHDTSRWYDAMSESMGPRTTDFARLFAVPGMAHCGGGVSTDRFDLLDAAVKWVEGGVAPDRIEASASNPAQFGAPQRTRPLCPYPQFAQYIGSGDINSAVNFSCR
jgi:hypothetical protein